MRSGKRCGNGWIINPGNLKTKLYEKLVFEIFRATIKSKDQQLLGREGFWKSPNSWKIHGMD